MTRSRELRFRRARLPSGIECDVLSSDGRGVAVRWRDSGRREWLRHTEARRRQLRLLSEREVRNAEREAAKGIRRMASVLAERGEASTALAMLIDAFPGLAADPKSG